MNQKELKNLIKQLVQEYTGTGAGGGNATDGNDITSPRVGGSFLTDEDEIIDYIYKNVYGGDGGHYTRDMYTGNYPNRHKMPMFELKKFIKKMIEEKRKHYGVHDTYGASPRQRRNLSGLPGVMEDENLKEFTDYGQEGIYPKKEKPGDMFQQKEVEDMFPNGMASRSDKAFQDRVKQHADWTEQGGYNNTFVHMQYHETKGLEDEYFIYQTQHYNTNYDDFRNPKFTLLSITKNKDTENEEDLGQYIVDTDAYIKDIRDLDDKGVLGKRVSENLNEQDNPYKMGEHPDFQLLIKTATEDLGLKVDETVRGGLYNGRKGYYLRINYRDLTFWSEDQIETLKKTFDKVNEITEEFTFEYEGVSDRDDEPGERIIEASFSFFAESKFKKQYMSKISPEDFKDKIKVGRKVKYMGSSYTVVSNNGFVLELEDEEGNKKTVNLNQFSHGGMVTEQISKAEQQTYERGLKRLQKGVLRYQLRFIEKQRAAALSQAATASSQASKGFDEQIKALQDQIDAIDNPPKQKQQNEGMVPCPSCGKMKCDGHTQKQDYEGKMAKSQLYKILQYADRLMHMLPDNAQLPAWVQSKFTKAAHNIGAAFHYLDYEMMSYEDNLMENIDHYKKTALKESTVKKFFKMFKKGKTNEEVLRHYAEQGITIPEQFLSKIRKQFENYEKQNLEIKFTEQEAKDIFTIPKKGEEPVLFDLTDEDKKLSSRLYKENKEIKKYPIPPEIKHALEDTLKMYPLIRFVKNLKAINSIPPSYRIFLLNGKHFDLIYESYSLMAKIGIDEYYLGNIDEKNYAIKHINRLMTEPIMKTGDSEETTPTTPSTPSIPPPPEPEEPEV